MFHIKRPEKMKKVENNEEKKAGLMEIVAVSLAVILMFTFGFGAAQAVKSIGGIEKSLIGDVNNKNGNNSGTLKFITEIPLDDDENGASETQPQETETDGTTEEPLGGIDPTGYSKAELIEYFNTAANRVRSEKPGFNYTEKSPVSNTYFAGMQNKMIDEIVNGFFKDISATVQKGQASAPTGDPVTVSYFGSEQEDWASRLTTSDVTNATCYRSGKYYIVNLKLISEMNPEMKGQSAYSRCLLIITKQGIKDLAEPKGLSINSLDDLSLSFHDGYITATIDSQGRIREMRGGFIVDGVAQNVSLAKLNSISGTVKMTISKTYTQTNFVW